MLHFWDYRDEPLKEPYGQVGYLEFLYDKHKGKGLRLFGVAVDGRFQQPEGARGAVVAVRKLKNFMNLSYPILFDGGDLVRIRRPSFARRRSTAVRRRRTGRKDRALQGGALPGRSRSGPEATRRRGDGIAGDGGEGRCEAVSFELSQIGVY